MTFSSGPLGYFSGPPSLIWILAQPRGFWNDLNYWVDTATWIDS
jgi:hypothetical protein